MGQNIDPHTLRIGVIKDWKSKLYAENSDIYKQNVSCVSGMIEKIGKVKDMDALLQEKQ